MEDELCRLQKEFDEGASWAESKQLVFYILKGLLEENKSLKDKMTALYMKAAFAGGVVAAIVSAIPYVIKALEHFTYHP